jgi:hypothetical protein
MNSRANFARCRMGGGASAQLGPINGSSTAWLAIVTVAPGDWQLKPGPNELQVTRWRLTFALPEEMPAGATKLISSANADIAGRGCDFDAETRRRGGRRGEGTKKKRERARRQRRNVPVAAERPEFQREKHRAVVLRV